MSSQTYSDVRDTTESWRHPQPTSGATRMCFKCGRPRPQLGGRIDRRTRQWICKECHDGQPHRG